MPLAFDFFVEHSFKSLAAYENLVKNIWEEIACICFSYQFKINFSFKNPEHSLLNMAPKYNQQFNFCFHSQLISLLEEKKEKKSNKINVKDNILAAVCDINSTSRWIQPKIMKIIRVEIHSIFFISVIAQKRPNVAIASCVFVPPPHPSHQLKCESGMPDLKLLHVNSVNRIWNISSPAASPLKAKADLNLSPDFAEQLSGQMF